MQEEDNPILGYRPSTERVAVYFASALVINAAAWFVMPSKYRAVVPVAVTTSQAIALDNNRRTVGGACGF